MKDNIATLKNIRRKTHELDPRSEHFTEHFKTIATETMDCLEGVNDMQEKNWVEKGLKIIAEPTVGDERRDRALSYLKEAVHNKILREENYRE